MLFLLFMFSQSNKRFYAVTCNKEASDMGFDTSHILLSDVCVESLTEILRKLAKNRK